MYIQICHRALGNANLDHTDLVYMAKEVTVILELKIAKFDLRKEREREEKSENFLKTPTGLH